MEYTKGEWKVIGENLNERRIKGDRLIAEIVYDEENEPTLEELKANAQLISASPRMYEALKEAENWFVLMEANIPLHALVLSKIKKAIAKAKEEK